MINFFSKFGSCYRRRLRRPPVTEDGHLLPIHTSSDYRRVRGNRVRRHRYPLSHWRPALSVIMEDSVDQDHDNNVNRKSDKSPGKNKSTADIACFSRWHDEGNPKPKIFVSTFSPIPYMF